MSNGRRQAYFPILDSLRALAVVGVMLGHFSPTILNRVNTGGAGVQLFFVLSGFLITEQLWRSRPAPNYFGGFYARRVLRIFPLYYAVVLIALLASVARGNRLAELSPVLLYAGFMQNLPGLVTTALQPISPLPLFHLWSLAVTGESVMAGPVT